MTTQFVTDSVDAINQLGIVDDSGIRVDAGESAFMERQLESVESRLYEQKLRELKFRRLIPVSNRDGAGAQTITYYLYTKVGMAKIIANPSDDLPRADIFATRHTANVHNLGTSFGFSTRELRSAQFAGVPLETQKADSARRVIREKENSIAWNGDAQHNILGFLNNPNIPTMEVAQNAGATSRAWEDKTPLEIVQDVSTLVSNIETTTKQVHMGDTLLLPIDKLRYISNTPMSATYPDRTILKYIKDPENGFGISEIESLPEMTGAGTGSTNLMALYEKDPEVLEARIPMELQTLPPQARNLEFLIPCEAENAGVVVRYPLACHFAYGF